MRGTSAERTHITMSTAETATTEQAAAVAAQGAHVAPEKAPSKKGRQPEDGRAQGPEGGKEGQGCRPEGSQAQKGAQSRSHQRGRYPPAREQGRKGPGVDQPDQGREPCRTDEDHRLAGPQCPRIHQRHAGHQDGAQGGIRQTRGRRAGVLDGQVASPSPIRPPGPGRGGLFCVWATVGSSWRHKATRCAAHG